MIIKYPDGRLTEGFLLSRQENFMRVALESGDDVTEFVEVQGNWVSEDLEAVDIQFEWQRLPKKEAVPTEADCICSKELASHLIALLETDSEEEKEVEARPRHLTAGQSIM